MNPFIIQSFNCFVDLSFGYPYETPYKFNGKEKDEETGYNNYEARYYGSDIGIFLSVDPLMDEQPWQSPYVYCANNPINKIDPTGMLEHWVEGADGIYWDPNAVSPETTKPNEKYLGPETYGPDKDGFLTHFRSDQSQVPIVVQLALIEVTARKELSNNRLPEPNSVTTPWINIAMAEFEKGVKEISGSKANQDIIKYLHSAGNKSNSDETPWCASFVHYCLGQAGITGAGPIGKSYLNWGTPSTTPVYGSVAVFKTGHVGFYVGLKGSNYKILHGNWSDQIKKSDNIKPSEIRIFRIPIRH